jgi:hypothetical protein
MTNTGQRHACTTQMHFQLANHLPSTESYNFHLRPFPLSPPSHTSPLTTPPLQSPPPHTHTPTVLAHQHDCTAACCGHSR